MTALWLAVAMAGWVPSNPTDPCSNGHLGRMADAVAWWTEWPCLLCVVAPTLLAASRVGERVELYALRHKAWPADLHAVYEGEPLPTDRWGHAFGLVVPGPGDLPFQVVSWGRDGVPGQQCGRPDEADLRWPAPEHEH